VLGSICWQLASFHGLDTDLIPDNYLGLVAYFNGLLQVGLSIRGVRGFGPPQKFGVYLWGVNVRANDLRLPAETGLVIVL